MDIVWWVFTAWSSGFAYLDQVQGPCTRLYKSHDAAKKTGQKHHVSSPVIPGQSTHHEPQERPLDKRVRRLRIQTGHFKSVALALASLLL